MFGISFAERIKISDYGTRGVRIRSRLKKKTLPDRSIAIIRPSSNPKIQFRGPACLSLGRLNLKLPLLLGRAKGGGESRDKKRRITAIKRGGDDLVDIISGFSARPCSAFRTCAIAGQNGPRQPRRCFIISVTRANVRYNTIVS